MNVVCRPHTLKGGLSVQANVTEGRLTKSAKNSQNLMTEISTLYLHGSFQITDVFWILLPLSMDMHIPICAYFLFTNVHYIRQRRRTAPISLTQTSPAQTFTCGINIYFSCKLYQAVQFYQSSFFSGCSYGMHMFTIS